VSDKQLQFTPKSDWPVDATFTVRFAKKGFFAREVVLEDYSADFKSQPFSAKLAKTEFYQDPRDPNLKKLVATVSFSHPVDTEQFEKRVSLAVAKDAAYLGLKPDSRNFTLVYDKFKLAAHIHSAALAMPRDDTPMTVRIEKGVRAARGGNETRERLESSVMIPGRASLRFSGAQMTLVDNCPVRAGTGVAAHQFFPGGTEGVGRKSVAVPAAGAPSEAGEGGQGSVQMGGRESGRQ
jgi:hypothetical protein